MPTKTTPKDFFLHLGATIALYTTAIALMNLAFNIINRALPDALANYWSTSSIVWPISMLIVLTPLLYVLEWLIGRDITRIPEKKDIWVRKWRIFLTLFLTGATIAGDLIVLINTYLNGEISSRFIWKVLVVLVVSAVIFAYYILERTTVTNNSKKWQTGLAWLGIILGLAGIIGGFVIVGSPATQRAQRFDEQRINDLSNIQSQILNYRQRVGKIPATLSALNDSLSGVTIPQDPETKSSYEYSVKGLTAFELCATFNLDSSKSSASYPQYAVPYGMQSNWDHGVGRTCFERTIDPQQYPVAPIPTPLKPPM